MSEILDELRAELRSCADPERARGAARFFRTGPGGYAEGDRFLGVDVPTQRRIARRFARRMGLDDVAVLLREGAHEERLTALLLLVERFRRGDEQDRAAVVALYLGHTRHVDNWDLVDSSAPYLLGQWLLHRDRQVLDTLVGSPSVWERRIAVLATFAFVRAGEFEPTLALAERLLTDPHDLVHKAVGWMLREVGNRDRAAEEAFLVRHHRRMPRVMLRYAIEKFPPERRRAYLDGTA